METAPIHHGATEGAPPPPPANLTPPLSRLPSTPTAATQQSAPPPENVSIAAVQESIHCGIATPHDVQPATPLSRRQPMYVPQFTTATPLILNRIKSFSAGSSSDDANRVQYASPAASPASLPGSSPGQTQQQPQARSFPPSPAEQHRQEAGAARTTKAVGTTLTIPRTAFSGPSAVSSPSSGIAQASEAGLKRKRDGHAVISSRTGLPTPPSTDGSRLAQTPTQPSRTPLPLPRICIKCKNGDPPGHSSNQLVACSSCGGFWHRMCHDPKIGDDQVPDAIRDTNKWYCTICSTKMVRAERTGLTEPPAVVKRIKFVTSSSRKSTTAKDSSNGTSVSTIATTTAVATMTADATTTTTINNSSSSSSNNNNSNHVANAPASSHAAPANPALDLKSTLSIRPVPLKVNASVPDHARISWADRTAGQKRAYFSTLSKDEMAHLLLLSTELHPDLPIFPPNEPSTTGLLPPAPGNLSIPAAPKTATAPVPPVSVQKNVYRNGIINSIRKSSANAAMAAAAAAAAKDRPPEKRGPGRPRTVHVVSSNGSSNNSNSSKNNNTNNRGAATITVRDSNGWANSSSAPNSGLPHIMATLIDPDEEDPTGLMAGWPQPGRGLYARLPPDWEDDALVDTKDYHAFSQIVYDERGRKIRENGMMVLVQ